MKKRNQLVSAMLAGMIISTMVGTTTWADDGQTEVASDVASTETSVSPEPAAPASSDSSSGSSSSSSSSSGSSSSTSSSSASAGSDSSQDSGGSSGTESIPSSGSADSGAQSIGSDTETPDSTGSVDSGTSDSGTDVVDSGSTDSGISDSSSDSTSSNVDSGSTDTSDDSGNTDSGTSDESGDSKSDASEDTKDTDSEVTDETKETDSETTDDTSDSKDEESKDDSSNNNTTDNSSKDSDSGKNTSKDNQTKITNNTSKLLSDLLNGNLSSLVKGNIASAGSTGNKSGKGNTSGTAITKATATTTASSVLNRISSAINSMGSAVSGNYTSSGSVSGSVNSVVLTEEERKLNRKAGFIQIEKKYAVVNSVDGLVIREGKGETSREIGTIANGGLLYILADEDDEWVFVESGDVRGFVPASALTVGDAANAVVSRVGEDQMTVAAETVSSLQNGAFRYSLNTTYDVPVYYGTPTTETRAAMIAYAETFLGGQYVWGGEDPHTGVDCSGYVGYVYRHFGIELPRTSYQQCEVGTKIDAKDAQPGDLIFYARNGVVYHVLMYIGDGKAVNAQSTATGIVISDVNYDKACWACTYITDEFSSTQATDLTEIGEKAYNGDEEAQQQIIEALAQAADKEWTTQGFLKSVLIAQVIQESGWLSFSGAADGGIQPEDNNILGMNTELLNDQWESPWTGNSADRNVPQYVNGQNVMGIESMRTYEDIESCLEDYAAFKIGIHPDIQNVLDVDTVIEVGLEGYATDPNYQESIRQIIEKYDLTRYDTVSTVGIVDYASSSATGSTGAVDGSTYTQDELELIWAIVAQEDDTSYEGALAVITSAMNRADINYGGYGTTALAQLTANGQYAYSPSVSDPSYYQRRLGGNVADFVKQAVSDCLEKGTRNHSYTSFRSRSGNGRTQIGSNWYFN